ncbi:Metallo-dependent phosphatase-like protein [Dichotomocladium elegans]|nr:Metallo-dependent phosphatase-like protein [Dichotomocladium elegans]
MDANSQKIHAGDLTRYSAMEEYEETIAWIGSLPHKLKIITGGNHDHFLDDRFGFVSQKQQIFALMQKEGIVFLEHEAYVLSPALGGYKMFVSPYAPSHYRGAFMPHHLAPYWDSIPDDTQILMTHTPPKGYHDRISRGGVRVGCPHLRSKIDTIKPLVSIFGHIHEDHGYTKTEDTVFVNASICDKRYRRTQHPVVFDLPRHQNR